MPQKVSVQHRGVNQRLFGVGLHAFQLCRDLYWFSGEPLPPIGDAYRTICSFSAAPIPIKTMLKASIVLL